MGEHFTCTVTNKEITLEDATLTVIKLVDNGNGGTADPEDFTMTVNHSGGGPISFPGTAGNTILMTPGETYSVREVEHPAYDADYSGGCSGEIVAGQNVTCTITNDDIPASLTVIKVVDNGDNGDAGPDDFGLTVDGTPVLSGVAHQYQANEPIAISETGLPGYQFVSISGDGCPSELGGTITMELATRYVCTITNDDIAPTLTVVKHVEPVDAPGTFNLYVDGADLVTIASADNVVHGGSIDSVSLMANTTYTVGETFPGDLAVDYDSWIECDDGSGSVQGHSTTITLAPGENITCIITNYLVTTEHTADGFMTGGGNVVTSGKGKNALRTTYGFMIRCPDSREIPRARFQLNDHYQKLRVHLMTVEEVTCTNNEALDPGSPDATFNTVTLRGTGRVNNVPDQRILVVLTDDGEPVGKRDLSLDTLQLAVGVSAEQIDIGDNTSDSPFGVSITGGNHQAHGNPRAP